MPGSSRMQIVLPRLFENIASATFKIVCIVTKPLFLLCLSEDKDVDAFFYNYTADQCLCFGLSDRTITLLLRLSRPGFEPPKASFLAKILSVFHDYMQAGL